VRREQVDVLARLVAKHASPFFPVVLTGDFNAQPDSDEIRRVEGHLTAPAVEGQLLIDSWRYADAHDPGLTWNRNNPHVAATYEPSARIDYVFVGPPGANGLGRVRSVGLIGGRRHDGVWPSDHAGVRVDLALLTER
jgi:endonuclease/exonuclease/phosphatase family metal-dependent hydrolase